MPLTIIAKRLLEEPRIAIPVINAIDCHHLGLIEEEPLVAYLKAFSDYAAANNPFPVESEVQEVADKIWADWKKNHGHRDKRSSISFPAGDAVHTVMTLGSLKVNFPSAYNSILAHRPGSRLSALVAKSSSAADEAVMAALSTPSGFSGMNLVLSAARTVWVRPQNRKGLISLRSAEATRNRLGLNHLPRVGATDSKDLHLLQVSFSPLTYKGALQLTRTSTFDRPGLRFRAFTHREYGGASRSGGLSHGMTLWLGSKAWRDGYTEMTFLAGIHDEVPSWVCHLLPGKLSKPHRSANNHRAFATHLIATKSLNASFMRHRYDPSGSLISELIRLISK